MKKVCRMLLDKRGAGTIMAMGLVLMLLLISTPFIGFMIESIRVFSIKQSVQSAVDSYTTNRGKIIVKSIKSGHDYSNLIDETTLQNEIQQRLAVRTKFKGYDSKGKLIYQIKDMKVKFIFDNTLKTELEYTLEYHYYFMSKHLISDDIGINQYSLYNLKY